jgi:hypothetical protein
VTNRPENTRPIKGHALKHEAAPHDEDGHRIDKGFRNSTAAGVGRALCECGALSEELPSRNKRAAWHRNHKMSIRNAQKENQS